MDRDLPAFCINSRHHPFAPILINKILTCRLLRGKR